MAQTNKRKRVAGVSMLETPNVSNLRVVDEHLEKAVIGSVLQKPEIYIDLSEVLQPADFYYLRHGYIWYAFDQLSGRGEAIDLITVGLEIVKTRPDYGDSVIKDMTDALTHATNPDNAGKYARVVADNAVRIRLMAAIKEIMDMANDPTHPLEGIIDQCDIKSWKQPTASMKSLAICVRCRMSILTGWSGRLLVRKQAVFCPASRRWTN